MTWVVGRKVLRLVAVVLVVTFVAFLLINLLPGDPAASILGASATPHRIALLRSQLGLDKPLPTRYLDWLGNVVRGNLGSSYLTNESVGSTIAQSLPVDVELMLLAELIAIPLAIVVAVTSAYLRDSIYDRLATVVTFGFLSLPDFILSILLILGFAVSLRALPASGYTSLGNGLEANLKSITLPAVTLAAGQFAPFTRVLRSEMITTLQEDFVALARAKGLSTIQILLRHALRPSSLPLITVIGLNVGQLIGGAIIVETIFALPGIGRLAVSSIYSRDYLMVQGIVLVVAVSYVTINFLVDIAYTIVDPRVSSR